MLNIYRCYIIILLLIAGCTNSAKNQNPIKLLGSKSPRDQFKGTCLIIEGHTIKKDDKEPIRRLLTNLITSTDSGVKINAINALGTLGPDAQRSIPQLLPLLNDNDITVQECVILALGEIHSQADLTVPALIQYALRDNDKRWLVYKALAKFGPKAKTATPHIKSSLNHSNESVRIYANHALKSISNTVKKEQPLSLTPLMETVCKKEAKDVKEMLDSSKCNVNAIDTKGKSALDWACMKGDNSIIKLLLEYGAKIDNVDRNGNTPLLFATFSKNYQTIKLLLEKGADVNSTNKLGVSPLIWSSQKSDGYDNIITLLINNGAELNLKDITDKTALDYAMMKNSNSKIIDLLRMNGAKTAKELEDYIPSTNNITSEPDRIE